MPGAPLVLLLTLGSGPTAVQGPAEPMAPVELRWKAPASCPEGEVVEREIARLLAGLDPPERPVRADVSVRGDAGSYRLGLRLTVSGEVGERSFDAASCEELVDAVALTIAIAVDPRALERAMDTEEGPAETGDATGGEGEGETEARGSETNRVDEPSPEQSTDSIEEPDEPRERRRAPEHRIAVAAAGGVGFGPLPGVAGLAGLEVAFLGERWRFGLVGTFWFPRSSDNPNSTDVGGRFLLGAAGLRGCFIPARGSRVSIPLCVGADAGAVQGEGYGQLDSRIARSPYLAFRAGPGLAIAPIRALAITLAVDGLVALIRPAFETEPSGLVYRAAPAGFVANLGLEWRIPTRRRSSEH